ncbi:MAG: hypothetical protein K9M13_00525 [Simkaniaceae bacterium]|nr:hypothetical protein [Simkaniaceae bacterium]
MKGFLFLSIGALLFLVGCGSSGYQINSYAISKNDRPIIEKKSSIQPLSERK